MSELPPRPWAGANTVMGAFVIYDARNHPVLEIYPGKGAERVVPLVTKAPETAAELERAEADIAELVGAITDARRALGLLRSIIQSGEAWTEEADAEYRQTSSRIDHALGVADGTAPESQ